MKARHGTKFLGLVIAGVAMVSVASGATSAQASSVTTGAVIRSANLFVHLKVCEIPGVREHMLAKGTETSIYAGEFKPTLATPWTTGTARIFLYVVSGTGVIQVGNMSSNAGPGDFIIIPKGARHAVRATSALRALYFEDRS